MHFALDHSYREHLKTPGFQRSVVIWYSAVVDFQRPKLVSWRLQIGVLKRPIKFTQCVSAHHVLGTSTKQLSVNSVSTRMI